MSSAPLLSLVVPSFNVAPYLPEFLASLELQGGHLDDVEILFVDDGSTDETASIISTWIEKQSVRTQLIRQANGGLSAARNAGMQEATGEWISFPDPDDRLTGDYLATVLSYLRAADPRCALAAAELINFWDSDGRIGDSHPLRDRFVRGQRLVSMVTHPSVIHLAANTGFYRLAIIRAHDLDFDTRVVPHFEDGHFTARYLVLSPHRTLGLIAGAHYEYRRRDARDSLTQTSYLDTRRYLDLPLYGFLGALEFAKERLGHVPEWLQNTVLYDLQWYFRRDDHMRSPTAGLAADVRDEYHRILRRILALIDIDTIWAFQIVPLTRKTRYAMLAMAGHQVRPWGLFVSEFDDRRGLCRIEYYFTGEQPVEKFRINGRRVLPVHAKTRNVEIFDVDVLQRRILWLPSDGHLTASIDDQRVNMWAGRERRRPPVLRSEQMWKLWRGVPAPRTDHGPQGRRLSPRKAVDAGEAVPVSKPARRPGPPLRRVGDAFVRWSASAWPVRRRYRGAWVLMDRDTDANDNAEHLYRHLRADHPDVNAWFVLRRESTDWDRLAAQGFRLVEFGSRQHIRVLRHARHLISSHVDHYVVHPYDRRRFGPSDWRFTFLQHGVIKDDLSRWLNTKEIDLFVTTTPAEYASIVDDGSRYKLTPREVRMTGLPRHDALLAKSAGVPAGERTLLTVMPTWREYLTLPRTDAGNARELIEDFAASDFATAWRSLLASSELRKLAERAGLQMVFMPHPNMAPALASFDLPDHVTVMSYAEHDVQDVLVRSAMVISDYSSLVFEAAYLRAGVVHYQFDRETFYDGRHVYSPGYFDYTTDGFGPVVTDEHEVVEAVREFVDNDCRVVAPFDERMDQTFTLRDGGACERVYKAIRAMDKPISAKLARRRPPPT